MNRQDQSEVAYETGPKEVADRKGLPSSEKQFGKADKMPQGNKTANGKDYVDRDYPANPAPLRFGEYR